MGVAKRKLNLTIERGIPLPPARTIRFTNKKRKPTDRYKLYEMKIGESVFVPGVVHRTLSGYMATFKKKWPLRFPDKPCPKFATRNWKDGSVSGIRIFRIG